MAFREAHQAEIILRRQLDVERRALRCYKTNLLSRTFVAWSAFMESSKAEKALQELNVERKKRMIMFLDHLRCKASSSNTQSHTNGEELALASAIPLENQLNRSVHDGKLDTNSGAMVARKVPNTAERPPKKEPAFLQNMKERERQRSEAKVERLLRQREQEEKKKLMEKQREKDERARQVAERETRREEERKRKIQEEQELQQRQVNNQLAFKHCKMLRLRVFGFGPWKALIKQIKDQANIANLFSKSHLQRNTLNLWRTRLKAIQNKREQDAQNMFETRTQRSAWVVWKQVSPRLIFINPRSFLSKVEE
jgi:hypothetical protein